MRCQTGSQGHKLSRRLTRCQHSQVIAEHTDILLSPQTKLLSLPLSTAVHQAREASSPDAHGSFLPVRKSPAQHAPTLPWAMQ